MAGSTLSRQTFERLQAELTDLTDRGRIDIARKIEAARALGDLSENGDYHAAKEAQGHMELRIRQIQALLKDATVVDEVKHTGAVGIGSVVTVDFDGDEERYLVGNAEERRDGCVTVSPESPLGAALLGKSEGERVTWSVGSNNFTLDIRHIGV